MSVLTLTSLPSDTWHAVFHSAPVAGIKDSKKSLMDLRSVAHDVTELATISAELAQQQEAVQQQLAASQQLAEAMRQQAQAHNCSLDEVVGHFFNVYNIACFVASDRERCAGKT